MSAKLFGWHLLGDGLVAHGMAIFQSPKNIFQRPKFSGKSLKFRSKSEKERFPPPPFFCLPNFRFRDLKIQSPEKCNSTPPPPQPFHTPTNFPPSYRTPARVRDGHVSVASVAKPQDPALTKKHFIRGNRKRVQEKGLNLWP